MAFLMILLSLSSSPGGVIHNGTDMVTAEEMIDILQGTDIVFVGEQHDDQFAHQWELFIWEALASGERALALEMFETDVQPLLDAYLLDEISEDVFLEGSRPWSNYAGGYSPLIEYARENGYTVIAANVPRMHAAAVARGGLDAISDESGLEDISVDSSNVLYRDMFLATMEAIGDQMHGMPMDPLDMYRAQLLKDAVMARSVLNGRCVFICGSFHSDYHSGIPDQLPPGTDYLTVTILAENGDLDAEMADFVIVRDD